MSWSGSFHIRTGMKVRIPRFNPYLLPHERAAIAAGSGTDETSEAQAQAEGSQSGPKGIAQGDAS